jgi:hypothetical protein
MTAPYDDFDDLNDQVPRDLEREALEREEEEAWAAFEREEWAQYDE